MGDAWALPHVLQHLDEPELGRFYARERRHARYALSSSDVEECSLTELLELADEESWAAWSDLTLGYGDVEGRADLRIEIAGLYPGLEPEDVLVCAGADEAILLALATVLSPGDHAVVTWPGYSSLLEVTRATGAAVSVLRLDPESGWAVDVDELRRLLRPTTRAVVVNFPHNPTGALPDEATFGAIAALTREVGAVLVADEVYRFLERTESARLPPVATFVGGVSLGALSKSFGLAGLRIGWLVTQESGLLARAAALKHSTSGCGSAPSEVLATIALRSREALLARSLARLRLNIALAERFFAEHGDLFDWEPPAAGCVAFPRLGARMPIDIFVTRLAREQGVLLVPGSVYGDTGNRFRIGLGRACVPDALSALGRFVDGGRWED
jgi:aspartate/methionine/tyrosine aminotransferase